MSKTLFDEVIGTPPPSTVDVPAIVRRRHRTATLRRAGIAVTAVVAVSAIVATGLSLAPGRGGIGPAAPSPDAIVPFGTLSPHVTPHDVADALKQAVATVAPDAQWAPDGRPQVVASPTAEEGAGALFGGAGTLIREGVRRRIAVSIGPAGDAFDCKKTSPEETCGMGLTPEGATMLIRRYWDSRYPQWIAVYRVDLALADGLVLQGYAYASKQLKYAPLGPVLSDSELARVVDEVASRLT